MGSKVATVTTVSRQANAKADAVKTTVCRVASDLLTIHERRPGGEVGHKTDT